MRITTRIWAFSLTLALVSSSSWAESTSVITERAKTTQTMPELSVANENASIQHVEQKNAVTQVALTLPAQTQPPRDTMYIVGRDGSGPSSGALPTGTTISRPDPISGPATGDLPSPNQAGPAPVDLNEKSVPPDAIGKPVLPGPIVDPPRELPGPIVDPPKISPPLEPWTPTPIPGVVFPKTEVKAGMVTVTSEPNTLTVQFNGSVIDLPSSMYTLDLAQGTITVVQYSSGWGTGKPTKSSHVVSITQGEAFLAALKSMMSHVDDAIASAKSGQRDLGRIKTALSRVYRIAIRHMGIVPVRDPKGTTPKQAPATTSYFGNRGDVQGGPAVAAVDNASH